MSETRMVVKMNERRFTVESRMVEIADPRVMGIGDDEEGVDWFVFYPDRQGTHPWGPARAADCSQLGIRGCGSLWGRRLVTQPAAGEFPVPEPEEPKL